MLVTTLEQFQALVNRLQNARAWSWDTETTGLSPYGKDRIIGLSFGIPDQGRVHTWYVPIRHERGHRLNLPPGKVFSALRPIFDDPEKTLVGWNAKFDLHFLHADKTPVRATVLDAMLAWYLSDENLMEYSLKGLASRVLGKDAVKDDKDLDKLLASAGIKREKDDNGKLKGWKAYLKYLSPLEAAPYAESDASLTYRMFRQVHPSLKRQNLIDIFYEICEYARVLELCERKGLKVDPIVCGELIDGKTDPETGEVLVVGAQERASILLRQLQERVGPTFNPDSHVQVRKWLGLESSAKEVLAEMEGVPGVSELLEYRGHAKALGNFYLPWRSRMDRFNRVHPSFQIHGTVSGRLSCREPNAQQIPRESSQWIHVKRMILAGSGCKLISADLSQAEFRLMAHYVQDPGLIASYCSGGADMHQYIADKLGITRQQGKTYNFAMIYGGGIPTIMRQLNCSEKEAAKQLNEYHSAIPGLRRTSYHYQSLAEDPGYVELWTGRRRHFHFVNGERFRTHTAFNNVVQGGAAEIVRIAMTKLDKELPEGAWMLGQVHDSILIECKNKLVPQVASMVKKALETTGSFRVPVKADVEVGSDWANMTKLE